MDVHSIADTLVEEISDTVDRHIHPRTGALMPPRLHGRYVVPDLKRGEQVIDRVDQVLEVAAETWRLDRAPEIYLDLCPERQGWVIAWVVETVVSAAGEEEGS